MPNGFKPVSVRDDVYAVASKLAADEETSIADVVTRAIENYKDYRKQLLHEFEQVRRLLKEQNGTK